MDLNKIYTIDALKGLKQLSPGSIDCVVTSPPYWGLRDYGVNGQIGLEKDFEEYIKKLLAIFNEVHRVLKDEGTVWVNISDTYWGSMQGFGAKKSSATGIQKAPVEARYFAASAGKPPMAKKHHCLKSKSQVLIPERFSLGMVEHGWIRRNTIIWRKPNSTPECVKDRFTNDFEYMFFFTKSKKYYFKQQFENFVSNEYDIQRMKEGRKIYKGKYFNHNSREVKVNTKTHAFVAGNAEGRNKRTVWEINTKPFREAHFAVFPEELIETPIKAGCPENGIILDPFMGSGTTAVVAQRLHRNYIGFDLNPDYVKLANQRIENSIKSSVKNNKVEHKFKELEQFASAVELGLAGI